ncbi:uncharacterized protein LOC101771546, partial [Setaria italica]|uniref:uncharacterized protein LOC101771546 n=1 Tax=Setaria italica TaxID=4555 RepID=UPI000BE5B82C
CPSSSARSSSASLPTSPSTSSLRPSSASPGSAPSATPPSAAATTPSTGRRLCSASSTGSRSSREIRPSSSPPPPRRPSPPTPTATARASSTAATAAYSSTWGTTTGTSSSGAPSPATSSACRSLASFPWLIYSAAVLCSVPGCDHLDCHGGLFRVVFIATDDDDELVKVSAYSSETGEWSVPVSLGDDCEAYVKHQQSATERSYYTPYVQPRWGAVIGDEIYFTLRRGNAIVKYDWSYNCLSMISPQSLVVYSSRISLMVTEDSSLGFACIGGSNLFLWSRKVNSQGAPEWVQCRVIDLEKIIPVADSSDERLVVGSAEGVGVIFISTGVGLFMIELKSGRVRKVDVPGVYFSILPYMSFYTPDHCRLSSVAKD